MATTIRAFENIPASSLATFAHLRHPRITLCVRPRRQLDRKITFRSCLVPEPSYHRAAAVAPAAAADRRSARRRPQRPTTNSDALPGTGSGRLSEFGIVTCGISVMPYAEARCARISSISRVCAATMFAHMARTTVCGAIAVMGSQLVADQWQRYSHPFRNPARRSPATTYRHERISRHRSSER